MLGRKTNNSRARVHWKAMQDAKEPWFEPRYWGEGIKIIDPSHLQGFEAKCIYNNWERRRIQNKRIFEFSKVLPQDMRVDGRKMKKPAREKKPEWMDVDDSEDDVGLGEEAMKDVENTQKDTVNKSKGKGKGKGKGKEKAGDIVEEAVSPVRKRKSAMHEEQNDR